MTNRETPFLLPLARVLALVVAGITAAGLLLGAAVRAIGSTRLPGWAGLLGGAAIFGLLVLVLRIAARPDWYDSWRDCMKR